MSSKGKHPSSPAARRARERHDAALKARQGGTTGRVIGSKVDLVIKLSDVPDVGVDVKERLPQAWVNTLLTSDTDGAWNAVGDASLDVHLDPDPETYRLRGTGHFAIAHDCVRCLQPVPFHLDVDFGLRLIQGDPERPPEEEDEGLSGFDDEGFEDDEDFVTYQGDKIDLGEIIREQIFLTVPMHPSCDSEGADPAEACAFDAEGAAEKEAERWEDPRWAALKQLSEQLGGGDGTGEA